MASGNSVLSSQGDITNQSALDIFADVSFSLGSCTTVGTPYVAAKAGVAQLVRQVALELARYNIRVNAIAPGPCVTNIGGGRLQDPANQEFFAQFSPQHRMAIPEDMQGAALFFASGASKHVTGAHVVIDGGVTLGVAD